MRPQPRLSSHSTMRPPQDPPVGRLVAVRCVKLAGILSMIGFLVFLVTLSVARGNETATGNAIVFYLIGALLFFACTVAAYFSVGRHNADTAIAFTGITVILMIVTFSFMVADLVSPDCTDNVVSVIWCVPGEPQRALPLVIQDAIILCILGLFVVAGLKVRKLNSTRKLEVLRANLPDVNGELGAIQPEQDEGGSGVPLE